MDITFTYKRKKVQLSIDVPGSASLYAVPASYSDDGFYVGTWLPGELEPVPACASGAAALLASLAAVKDADGTERLLETHVAKGVTYA